MSGSATKRIFSEREGRLETASMSVNITVTLPLDAVAAIKGSDAVKAADAIGTTMQAAIQSVKALVDEPTSATVRKEEYEATMLSSDYDPAVKSPPPPKTAYAAANNARAARPLRSSPLMRVFVRTLTGQTLTLCPLPSTKISRLKDMIENHEAIPAVDQRIIFGGRQMQDDKTLHECEVVEDCTLHLVRKLRGS